MAKQSKNRVKLNKQYKSIGKIPVSALKKISEFMDLPALVRDIRSSENNMVKHKHRHIDELEEQLKQLGITKEGNDNKKGAKAPFFFSQSPLLLGCLPQPVC